MPGNRAIYNRAMEQSREAARQNRWEDALKNAVRALQEFPQQVDARTAVAVSLFHTGKLAQALQTLESLHAADPENPFFLEYIAHTHENQGNIEAAVTTYQTLAQLHQDRQSVSRAIKALRDVLRLRPTLNDQHQQLAELLKQTGARREAATEYLMLAHRYHERALYDAAAINAEAALQLDPNSRGAKELLATIHEAMARAAGVSSGPTIRSETTTTIRHPIHESSPIATGLRSQQFALDKIVALAIEKQQAGDNDGAIKEYERALEAGMSRADVLYSLGLLYQERGDYNLAVEVLEQATTDAEYALSSHYALGSCYAHLRQLPQAAQEYEQAIHMVDLETIDKAEVDDLIQMYESAVDIYQQLGDLARAASLYSTLASFLQGKRWGKERAAEFNQRAKELTERNMLDKLRFLGTGVLSSPQELPTETPPPAQPEAIPETWGKIRPITDFLRTGVKEITTGHLNLPAEPAPSPDPLEGLDDLPALEKPTVAPLTPLDTTGLDEQLKRWITATEKYIEQGLLEAALDACYQVIRFDPDYLPIHLRIGEIYERQSRPKEALTKYQIFIDTYMVRNEPEQAIDVYFRAIELSPDIINMRSRLAELLRKAERMEEAANQLAIVADNYLRMGQTSRALEEYRRLLQWSPRDKALHTQYGLALFKLERYEHALSTFRKALDLDTNDPLTIAHINMTLAVMGNQPATVWESLATLLEHVRANPQINNMVQAEYRAALLMNDLPILHYILGIIQQCTNQHSSALFELEQAQVLLQSDESPMVPMVLVHQAMADSYIALGQAEQALDQLRQGQAVANQASTDPTIKHPFATPLSRGDLVRRMAEAYAASDDLPGAERALLEAKRLLPYDRAIYTKLADIYFRQGKLTEAVTQLEDLANYYESHQHLDHAIEILQNGLKLAPNSISIGNHLALLHIRRGFPDKGVQGLVRVADQQRKAGQLKDAVASLQRAAEILWMQGKHDEAREIYDKIVQIAPNDVEARQWLAIMHTLAFRTKEAIAEKKQIVRILSQQNDYDHAIAELHQIIGLDQKDIEAYYLLGELLMRRGEYVQGVQLYKRMLKIDGVDIKRVESLLAAANRMVEQRQKLGNQ